MPDNLQDTIRENAAGPAKAAGDAGSVEQHKLTGPFEPAGHWDAVRACTDYGGT